MYVACAEHKNQIRFATSSVVPRRRIGMSRSTISEVRGDSIAVSISPGAIALTRTPVHAKSTAISRVRAASEALGCCVGGPGETVHPRTSDRREISPRRRALAPIPPANPRVKSNGA